MKDARCFFLLAAAAGFTGCDTMNQPLSTGSFDPLVPPGRGQSVSVAEPGGFRPGQFVETSLDNTSFFRTKPKGDANADKLLAARTPMKIVAVEGSYLKVELDNGEVGYVPSILVTDPNAVPSPNEVQVYPPLQGTGTDNVPVVPLEPGADPQAPADDTLPAVIEPDGTKPVETPPATGDGTPKPDDTPKPENP